MIGIIVLVYIIQTMENKAKEKEINNLRMNGINQNHFYQLYYYENRLLFVLVIICCMIGYVIAGMITGYSISIMQACVLLLEVIVYMIITRVIPLVISAYQIFRKDISEILRND